MRWRRAGRTGAAWLSHTGGKGPERAHGAARVALIAAACSVVVAERLTLLARGSANGAVSLGHQCSWRPSSSRAGRAAAGAPRRKQKVVPRPPAQTPSTRPASLSCVVQSAHTMHCDLAGFAMAASRTITHEQRVFMGSTREVGMSGTTTRYDASWVLAGILRRAYRAACEGDGGGGGRAAMRPPPTVRSPARGS